MQCFVRRNDTSARRLYRRALDAVPKDPPLQGHELTQPVKLLFKWAHQEFKGDNLFQVRLFFASVTEEPWCKLCSWSRMGCTIVHLQLETLFNTVQEA